MKDRIRGAVSSSNASTERLLALGIPVFDSNEVGQISVYIDGADEIDRQGFMIKGGGAALTREKIVAAQSSRFVCIADESKLVDVLGAVPGAGGSDPHGNAAAAAAICRYGRHGARTTQGRRAAGH